MVKFRTLDTKKTVLQSAKAVRPNNLYVRENLTAARNAIMYVLRKARREFPNIVSGCTSIDGNVYVFLKPPNPNAAGAKDSRMAINSNRKLEKFCTDVLCAPDFS